MNGTPRKPIEQIRAELGDMFDLRLRELVERGKMASKAYRHVVLSRCRDILRDPALGSKNAASLVEAVRKAGFESDLDVNQWHPADDDKSTDDIEAMELEGHE